MHTHKYQKGLTLVELVVVIGLLAIVGLSVGAAFTPVQTIFYETQRLNEARMMCVSAATAITEELRFASEVSAVEGEIEDDEKQTLRIEEGKLYHNESIIGEGIDGSGMVFGWNWAVNSSVLELTLQVLDTRDENKVLFSNVYAIRLLNNITPTLPTDATTVYYVVSDGTTETPAEETGG